MAEDNPKLFISYSWSSPEHEQWVLNLATELRDNGIDVILDKWDLREGHDAYAFMELMVSDPDIKKVILVCDRVYAEKADGRSGGVGTETQIITPEIYAKQDQDKFVAVVTEKDENGNAYVPVFYKSRIYIDLSDSDRYAPNFEQLLRWIYDQPVFIKPELGKKPAFLMESTAINLGTTTAAKRALDAIRLGKDHAGGSLSEYFSTFVENLERFGIERDEREFDEQVIENIEQFLPYRNEVIGIILALAQYRNIPDTYQRIHRFFEELASYMFSSGRMHRSNSNGLDNFRFLIHELFLYTVACLLKYERFEGIDHLLRYDYYTEQDEELTKLLPYRWICRHVHSLERRNQRLNLGRISVRADLLKERTQASGISFEQLLQADFVLYIHSCFDYIHSKSWIWPTETLVYADGRTRPFEVFARAQSKSYFERFMHIFNVTSKEEVAQLIQLYREDVRLIPRWNGYSIEPEFLMGYEKLATRP